MMKNGGVYESLSAIRGWSSELYYIETYFGNNFDIATLYLRTKICVFIATARSSYIFRFDQHGLF